MVSIGEVLLQQQTALKIYFLFIACCWSRQLSRQLFSVSWLSILVCFGEKVRITSVCFYNHCGRGMQENDSASDEDLAQGGNIHSFLD